jgi:signal transduction histidine kinase
MVISSGLQQLCSELDKFKVAAAIGHTSRDAFVRWNRSFTERLGLMEDEIKGVELRNIIIPTDPVSDTRHGPEVSLLASPFSDCVIRIPGNERQILGRSVRREDGFLLVVLDPASGNRGTEEYARGYLIGQEAEKQRSRQVMHDTVSGNLLAASFAAENAKQKLEDDGRPEAEDLKRVTSLIDQAINDLVTAFTSGPSITEEESSSSRSF